MLDKSKLMYLNSKQSYDEIFNIFQKEYEKMITNFFDKNEIEYIKNGPMSYYLEILETSFDGKYNDVCKVIKAAFMVEQDKNFIPLSVAIDSYNFVKKRLE